MASETKVEPIGPAVVAVPAVRGSRGESTARGDGGASDDAKPRGVHAQAGDHDLNDDEDVSLDELMISDSNDPLDEEEEATDARGTTGRLDVLPKPLAASDESEPDPLEDDEAAALAAAAAAQEAAAQRAAREAEAELEAAAVDAPEAASPEAASPEADSTELDVMASDETEPAAAPDADDLEPDSVHEPDQGIAAREGGVSADDLAGDEAPEAPAPDTVKGAPVEDRDVHADARGLVLPPPLDNATGEASDGGEPSEPEPARAPRRDAPLPSFDITEVAASARRGLAAVTPPAIEPRSASRGSNRPMVAPLAPLSEIAEEDDDDAVTHIGLPVLESSNEYPADGEAGDYSVDGGGFAVAEPNVAALAGYDPESSPLDARRATTRVIARIDPSQVAQHRQREMDTMPPARRDGPFAALSAWGARAFGRLGSASLGADANRRRLAWLIDNALRPVSLVLFGSGIGAGIMLLQLDTGAHAAQETQTVQALKDSSGAQPKPRPTTLIERAEAGEGEALFKITNMPASERTSALTLALERGHQTQKLNEWSEFARALDAPGGALQPNVTVRLLGYATSPETMLPALAHISRWSGSRGPDVLYAIWEKAPGGARAAGLAQQLLHSEDQRAKATPSLKTVLDLRAATSCDDYLRVLPAVLRDGDQRCSATLRALKHTDGCGDDGQQDCYGCLRDTTLLDEALTAVENRVPPQL